jgi:hypothetical protein
MSACVNCELDRIVCSSDGNASRVHLELGIVNATYLAIGWMSVVASARVTESSMMSFLLALAERLSTVEWSADWRKVARSKAWASCAHLMMIDDRGG